MREPLKAKPKKLSALVFTTALFVSFTFNFSFRSKNRRTLAMTRSPARRLFTKMISTVPIHSVPGLVVARILGTATLLPSADTFHVLSFLSVFHFILVPCIEDLNLIS
ncbi:MAG: hypothetical protein SynsKO_44830 [Synoicihabitans sp.]